MTKNQLDAALASTAKDAGTAGQSFYVPTTYLRLIRAVLAVVAAVVPGVPSQAAPTSFSTPMDAINLIGLLNYPQNGYKLYLPVGVMRMTNTILRRVVRKMDGSMFTYDDNGNPTS